MSSFPLNPNGSAVNQCEVTPVLYTETQTYKVGRKTFGSKSLGHRHTDQLSQGTKGQGKLIVCFCPKTTLQTNLL